MPKEDPFVNRAQLLKAIKKYPEIWDSNNRQHMCRSVTSPMWNEIAEQFGGHVPTVKLQSIWSQMKYHYHNLVHRQILHKDRFTTKWEHFEPMSFMYNITVAKIVSNSATSGAANAGDAANNGNAPEDAATTPDTPPAVATPAPTPTPTPQNLSNAAADNQPSAASRGRPSGQLSWLAAPSAVAYQPQQPYTVFTGLVPPAAVTIETSTASPAPPVIVRKLGRPSSLHSNGGGMRTRIIEAIRLRPQLWIGRQRERQQQPAPVAATATASGSGQNRTSAIWREVAQELNLTPTLIQTRWSIIKQRYVDELQKERRAHYAQQPFHSTWEHFDRMSFMREILIKKVDEREQTREQIQELISEQHQKDQLQQQQQQQQQQQHQQQHQQHIYGVLPEHAQSLPLGLLQHPLAAHLPHHQLIQLQQQQHELHPAPALIGRRRPKTEADMEWDPFEMILQAHGANNAESHGN